MEIAILGQGGQGIQTVSLILANILEDKNYQVALTSEYDSFIRNAKSNAYLKFSKNKIKNPLVQNPEKVYRIGQTEIQPANMFLLGRILKELNILPKNISKYIKINKKENLKAIKLGIESWS